VLANSFFQQLPTAKAIGYELQPALQSYLKEFGSGICQVWQAGKDISLDKSMIKYCSRAVAFIQYKPEKPIKHGIKVFCLCCAAVMLAFEVYCKNENNNIIDNTRLDIYERLTHKADLVNNQTGELIHGCTIYSNNNHTSVKMTKHLYKIY
jgi:hypothetical protein